MRWKTGDRKKIGKKNLKNKDYEGSRFEDGKLRKRRNTAGRNGITEFLAGIYAVEKLFRSQINDFLFEKVSTMNLNRFNMAHLSGPGT